MNVNLTVDTIISKKERIDKNRAIRQKQKIDKTGAHH